jgi:hypothetical protein
LAESLHARGGLLPPYSGLPASGGYLRKTRRTGHMNEFALKTYLQNLVKSITGQVTANEITWEGFHMTSIGIPDSKGRTRIGFFWLVPEKREVFFHSPGQFTASGWSKKLKIPVDRLIPTIEPDKHDVLLLTIKWAHIDSTKHSDFLRLVVKNRFHYVKKS